MDKHEFLIHDRTYKDPPVKTGAYITIPQEISGAVIKHPYVSFTIRSHIKPRFTICHIGQHFKDRPELLTGILSLGEQLAKGVEERAKEAKHAEDAECTETAEPISDETLSTELRNRYLRLVNCVHLYQGWTQERTLRSAEFKKWKGEPKVSRASKHSSQTTAGRHGYGTRSVTQAAGEGSAKGKRDHHNDDEDPPRQAPRSSRGQGLVGPSASCGRRQEQKKSSGNHGRNKDH